MNKENIKIELELEEIFEGMKVSEKTNKEIFKKLKNKYNSNDFEFDLSNELDLIKYLKEEGIISFYTILELHAFNSNAVYDKSKNVVEIKKLVDSFYQGESIDLINKKIKAKKKLFGYFQKVEKDKYKLSNIKPNYDNIPTLENKNIKVNEKIKGPLTNSQDLPKGYPLAS